MKESILKAFINESKDGEWGKADPFEDSVQVAVIRGTDFENVKTGNLKDLPIRHIPKRIFERKQLAANDIIIETAGGSKDKPTGRVIFLKEEIIRQSKLPLICASFSRFIRIDPAKIDPEYLFWYLHYMYQYGMSFKYHTQHTGVARFQWTVFSENEPLFIEENEQSQHSIAKALSNYNNLIENNNRRIAILEEMAQSLYREWFVKFRFPGHESIKFTDSPLGKIPEGWGVKSINSFIDIKSGFAFKSKSFVPDGEYQLITIKNVKDGQFVPVSDSLIDYLPPKLPEYCHLRTGDILLSLTGNVGRTCLVYGENYLLNQRVAKLVPKIQNTSAYIYFMYRQPELQKRLEMISTGVAQQNLSPVKMGELEQVFPTEDLTRKYSAIAKPIVDEMLGLWKRNLNLQNQRDLLLPKLISGKITV